MAVKIFGTTSAATGHATTKQEKNVSTSSLSLESSQSNHSGTSSSSFGSLSCITVRKKDPSSKAGIQLEQDSKGQVTITNIASNGLFAKTDLKVGDIVLAVNKKKLSEGEGPEVLMNIVHKFSTISISVKKPSRASSIGAPLKRRPKKKQRDRCSILWGSSHHHKLKPRKHPPRDTKNSFIDAYYGDLAQCNSDESGPLKLENDTTKTTQDDPTNCLTISASKASPSQCIGVDMKVKNNRLVVKSVSDDGIFWTTNLMPGDIILSINDLSFRKFADVQYAISTMEKAPLMVTLIVERPDTDEIEDENDDDDDEDDYSLSSFGNDEDQVTEDYDADTSQAFDCSANYDADASQLFNCSFASFGEIVESDFKIEKYRPVTISVPKAHPNQDAGLVFKMVRTKKQGLYNPTISHLHPDAPAHPQRNPPPLALRHKKATWVYVDSIKHDSIFKDTSLRRGDKVLCINNTNLKNKPDPRAAYKACHNSREAIAIVVLKDDQSVFKEKSFEFDNTSEDLDW